MNLAARETSLKMPKTPTGSNRFQNKDGIISVTEEKVFPFQDGIGTVLFERMRELKKEIAQVDSDTGEKDTYEAFLERCIRTAITMRSRGVTPNDIITVCSSNHLNTCVPLIASFFLGVKFANADPNLSQSDTAFLLNKVRPKMVFVSPEAVTLVEDALEEIGLAADIVVFGDSSKHSQFEDFLGTSPEEKHFVPIHIKNLKETAGIFFSSGTTGSPKGICVTHKGLLGQAVDAKAASAAFPVVLLTYSSAYWISLSSFFIVTIIAGGCRLIAPEFNHTTVWKLVEKYKVSVIVLTPSQSAIICQNGRPGGVDTSSLLLCLISGGLLSKEQIETLRQMMPNAWVIMGYGLTEVGGGALGLKVTQSEDLELATQKPTTCGRPMSGFLYKVVDPETEEILGPNQQGELRFKTDFIMNGYYKSDSSDVWDSDGFFKTGDLVYYEQDYCFYFVDRIKEMLKYQGWQIAPAMLEAVLMTHPAIECAVVIGLPHYIDGDHAMGIVILGEYEGTVTSEEVQKYVEERVSDKQKLRGGVKIVKSLPLTPSKKFKKKHIRDLAIAGKL